MSIIVRWLRFWAIVVGSIVVGLGMIAWGVARAQDGHEGHQRYHEWYQHWKQPGGAQNWQGGPASCCNAREVDWGSSEWPTRVMGDCYSTSFRLKPNGSWEAKLDRLDQKRFGKEWIEVPEAKIIRERNPDLTGRDGHLCTGTDAKILCAVPPVGTF